MDQPQIAIATLGHTNHGKSTLIGRLLVESGQALGGEKANLSCYLDALKEEQKGGITIDSGYANYRSAKYRFTIIDSPGHREFIKNMLTGASRATGVTLVVSAQKDQLIQEQTRRHLNLAKFLGIKEILVAVNKMDTADYQKARYQKIKEGVRKILGSSGYDPQKITFVPTSAQEGENITQRSTKMTWYRGPTFTEALDETFSPFKKPDRAPLRGMVQKIHHRGGDQLIVVQLVSGSLQKGDPIYFPLTGLKTKVLGINASGETVKTATAGEGVGIKIRGNSARIPRGDLLCRAEDKDDLLAKTAVTAQVFVLSEDPLSKGARLGFRCGTRETSVHIKRIERRISSETLELLEENASETHAEEFAILKIGLKQPVAVEPSNQTSELNRLILTQNGRNLAAGTIVHTNKDLIFG
jgi:elongation factor 1-alpha